MSDPVTVIKTGKAVVTATSDHMKAKREVPTWLLYVLLVVFGVVVVAAGWGWIRAARYHAIARAAKIEIAKKEADRQIAKYQEARKLGKKVIDQKTKKEVNLDAKLKSLEEKRTKLKKAVGRMNAKDLRDAFNQDIE